MGLFDALAGRLNTSGYPNTDQESQQRALALALLTSGLRTVAGAGSEGLGAIAPGLGAGLGALETGLGAADQRGQRDRALDLEEGRLGVFERRAELDEEIFGQKQVALDQAAQQRQFLIDRVINDPIMGTNVVSELRERFPEDPLMDLYLRRAEGALETARASRAKGFSVDTSVLEKAYEDIAERTEQLTEVPATSNTEKEYAFIAEKLGEGAADHYLKKKAQPEGGGYASKVDLAVAAVQGDLIARAALEVVDRGESLQNPGPFVDALAEGDITIANVPSNMREAVLLESQNRGIEILSDQERKQILQLEKVKPLFKQIADLSERINQGEGLLAKLEGSVERAQAKVNYDDDVALYDSMVETFTPMVARAVGHVGVLTELDVQSARAMFPQPGDSKSLRDRKVAAFLEVFEATQRITRETLLDPIREAGSEPGLAPDFSNLSNEELFRQLQEPPQ